MNPFELWMEGVDVTRLTALSFKFNILPGMDISYNVQNVLYYARSTTYGVEKHYATAGKHVLGENDEPHIHVNVCVLDYKKDSNESRRRSKYFEMNELEPIKGLTCKITQIKDVEDMENTLKYPWKEGEPIPEKIRNQVKIPQEVEDYMLGSAKALFEVAKANQRKKQRASERSKTLLGQIQEIVGDRSFQNYDEFKKYVAQEFLQPLDLEEYPDMSNFRKALEKVAVQKKIVSYHYFL